MRRIAILDLAGDARAYAAAALRHRPDTAEGLRVAAVSLRRQGLSARDVGQALRLSEHAVQTLLEGSP